MAHNDDDEIPFLNLILINSNDYSRKIIISNSCILYF